MHAATFSYLVVCVAISCYINMFLKILLMFLAWIAQQLHASATPNASTESVGLHHVIGTSCGSCRKLSWSQESE